MKDQELEVKFYVSDLTLIEKQLLSLGAKLTQKRTFEANLRFDTADKRLSGEYKVLRLRLDTAARLTYKGPAEDFGGARLRQEIEFEVSDFDSARNFLEAVGFELSMVYEKYRSMYDFHQVHVTLDELPFGYFVELEGNQPDEIKEVSSILGLDWDAQVMISYVGLFEQLKVEHGFTMRDLTFENFTHIQLTPEQLHVRSAI
jgi:adenylate cyclase class 2